MNTECLSIFDFNSQTGEPYEWLLLQDMNTECSSIFVFNNQIGEPYEKLLLLITRPAGGGHVNLASTDLYVSHRTRQQCSVTL